jgi:hypothetical protein
VNRQSRYRWIADVTNAIDQRDWGVLLFYATVIAAVLLVILALRIMFAEGPKVETGQRRFPRFQRRRKPRHMADKT